MTSGAAMPVLGSTVTGMAAMQAPPGVLGAMAGAGAAAEPGGAGLTVAGGNAGKVGKGYGKAGEESGDPGTLFAALLTAALAAGGRATESTARPAPGGVPADGGAVETPAEAMTAAGMPGVAPAGGETVQALAGTGVPAPAAGASPSAPKTAEESATAQEARLPDASVRQAGISELPARGTAAVVVAGVTLVPEAVNQNASRLDRVFGSAQSAMETGERQVADPAPEVGGEEAAAPTPGEPPAGQMAGATEPAAEEEPSEAAMAARVALGDGGTDAPAVKAEEEAEVPSREGGKAWATTKPAVPEAASAAGESGAGARERDGREERTAGQAQGTDAAPQRRSAVGSPRPPGPARHEATRETGAHPWDGKVTKDETAPADTSPAAELLAVRAPEGEAKERVPAPAEAGATAEPAPTVAAAQSPVAKAAEQAQEVRRSEPHLPSRAELKELPQLVRKAELLARAEGPSEMRLQLVPEHLGRLTLRVSVAEGTVTARLVVENSEVKALVEQRLPELTRSLQDQGLRLADVSVGCESSGGNLNYQAWQGQRDLPRGVAYGSARREYDDLPAGAAGLANAAANHQWRGSGGVVDALI